MAESAGQPETGTRPLLSSNLLTDDHNVQSASASTSLGITPSSLRSRSRSPAPRSSAPRPAQGSINHADRLPTPPPSDTSSDIDPNELKDHTYLPSRQLQTATWTTRIHAFWTRQRAVLLVLASQIFGVSMNVTTRILELPSENEHPMHPFQVMFVRMSITAVLATLYIWYAKIPDAPFGPKNVRLLLIMRGVGGFFGAFGIYASLPYLGLADITVIGFLAPPISCYLCSFILKEPFTRLEQLATLISLFGVVLIAQPATLFRAISSNLSTSASTSTSSPATLDQLLSRALEATPPQITPIQRLYAVSMALVSVCGAVCAYSMIRWIGHRAHAMLSVNYFAWWSTIISSLALLLLPGVHFEMPHSGRQWGLIIFLGTSGFVLQCLLTYGLRAEKSSRATNMMYMQMIFALFFDFLIWGIVPNWLSLAGSVLIVGSALVVVVMKEGSVQVAKESGGKDEEVGLMAEEGDDGPRDVAMHDLSRR